MGKHIEITVAANADLDDCLEGAAEAYLEEHPELAGYDLSPRWTDDDSRETVSLTVPASHLLGARELGTDGALDAALPRDEARELCERLEDLGVEASWAPDHDDRALAWVYVG